MVFCYVTMGRAFTLKTLIVNVALSAATQAVPLLLTVSYVHPLFAALVGGTFLGMGVLSLARHNASVGGTGVVTLWLQRRTGINAGKSQMVLDVLVFALSHADELAQAGPLSGELTAGLADGREGKKAVPGDWQQKGAQRQKRSSCREKRHGYG